jgi:DNA-binding LacI/PurR family transcriptional regulator
MSPHRSEHAGATGRRAHGRRRIAFAAGQLDPRVMQRAEGYRSAPRAAGVYDPALEFLTLETTSMGLGARQREQRTRRAIGESAATMPLELMRGERVMVPTVDVGYELVVRGST